MQSSLNLNGNFSNKNAASKTRAVRAPELARFTFAALQGFGDASGNSARVTLTNPRFGKAQKTAPTSPNLQAFLG